MKIVIVGASFSGLAAAVKSRQLYPESSITIIEKSSQLAAVPMALEWLFKSNEGEVPSYFDLLEQFKTLQVDYFLNHEVQSIDPAQKRLSLRGAQVSQLSYDCLIVATGSTQKSHYIKGGHHPGVLLCKDDMVRLEENPLFVRAKEVALIGGGQLGLRLSEKCQSLGKHVHLFEAGEHLDFKHCDADMAALLETSMVESGLNLYLSHRVQKIEKCHDHFLILTKSAKRSVDVVLMCAGLRPNTHFLEDQHILANDGTIPVNAFLETKLPQVFAVGDTIKLDFLQENDPRYLPLINTAIRTGEIAAYNLNGPRIAIEPSVKLVSGYYYGWFRTAIGMTSDEAELFQEIAVITYKGSLTHDRGEELRIKLIVSRETGQLLGAQLLSAMDCSYLLQCLVQPIRLGMTDLEIAFQDFLMTVGQTNPFYHLHKALLMSASAREV